MPTEPSKPTVDAAELARLRARAAEARVKFAHKPGVHELLTPEELADGAPFYFELRAFVKQLKDAREASGMTVEQVAEKAGLAAGDLAELESGMMTNPPYRLLGLYAAAVGRRITLTADPPRPDVS